jgi:hypothetical protein
MKKSKILKKDIIMVQRFWLVTESVNSEAQRQWLRLF